MATTTPDPGNLPARDPVTAATHWCPVPYYPDMRLCVVRDGDLARTKDDACITCGRKGMVQNYVEPSSEPARNPNYRGILAGADPVDDWEARIKRLDAAEAQQAPAMVTGYCQLCADGIPCNKDGFHSVAVGFSGGIGSMLVRELVACTGEYAPGLVSANAETREKDEIVARLTAERDQARAKLVEFKEDYNSEVDEFNAGVDAGKSGADIDGAEQEYNWSHDSSSDNFRPGYAWGAFERLTQERDAGRRELAELKEVYARTISERDDAWDELAGAREALRQIADNAPWDSDGYSIAWPEYSARLRDMARAALKVTP